MADTRTDPGLSSNRTTSNGRLMRDLVDSTPEAQQRQIELLRRMSPAERIALALRLTSDVIQASKRAIARAHPEFSPRQVEHQFIELHYLLALANAVRAHDGMAVNGD